MASLEDFNAPTQRASLNDFQIEGPLVPVSNKPSNVNLAAYTAALSENPESVEANYLAVSSEMDSTGDSRVAEELFNRATSVSLEKDRQTLISILTDPELDDETKSAAANAYLDDRSSLRDIRNIVATESLIAQSDEDETAESSNTRINFAENIEAVNQAHRDRQVLLNQELASRDPNLLQLGVGFLELLVPYMEQGITEQILNDVRGGDKTAWLEAITLMGNAKETLPDVLRKLPHEERAAATQMIIDAVNANSSIVFADRNDFARIDFLRSALEEGYYGDLDRWIDNAVSIIDLAIPFAPMLGRGVRTAGRVVRSHSGPVTSEAARAERAMRYRPEPGEALESSRTPNAALPDDELRAAEDAAEAAAADRRLVAQEEASEQRLRDRREEMEADPVRRAESGAEAREESRRAVRGEGRESLSEMEAASEARIQARRTGGNAARMTDNELIAAERAYELEVARKRYVQSEVQPVSLSQVYRNTNPGKARAASALAAQDTTGQAARALYGSSRTEAVAFDNLGPIHRSDDLVQNKVSLPDATPRPTPANARVMDVLDSSGAIHLTDKEKLTTATRIINDFNNAVGLVARTEMSAPRAADDLANTFNIGVVYGPRDGGWSSGVDAVERVKTSLRNYGVKDEDITLMARRGDDYAPINPRDAVEGGDYLVRVDYPYTFNAADIKDWSTLDVFWNFFDRVPHITAGRHGSLQRHIIDAHSMLHPNITHGANVSVDRSSQLEKTLLELTKTFANKYNKLSKHSKAAFEQEIKRANREGRNATNTELRAKGWGDEEVSTLRSWREVWDTMYWLENQDMVKTLRNRNYKVLEDPSTDTRLFVKEVPPNQAGSHKRAYDPETGEMRNLSKEELKDLYEKGGSVASLRSKMLVGDEAAEFVITRNQPGGTFARRLRDDDQILNYREGYYTVYYQDPKMIDKIVRDSHGNILKRGAIATAGDTSSANRVLKRLRDEAEPNTEYVVRDSRERLRFDGDDNWSLQEAQGRTAQRVRGERLEDATSPITDEAHNHVMGPVDSLIRSVRNVSSRVPMRDYLETAKTRAIHQYGHMFPKNKFGQPEFPSSSKDIRADLAFGKEASDARTTVEYLNALEYGYINQMDEWIKMGFRALADAAGEKGLTLTERALNFAGQHGGPTRLGRGTAFTLYLALNPLRQFIVQSHQAIQLFARHPQYAGGRLVGDAAAIIEYKTTGRVKAASKLQIGRTEEELLEMARLYDSSGLSASIDKSNLVRNTLTEIADATSAGGYRRSVAGRAGALVAQGVGVSRKAGFDIGEEINMLTSWLTHYDLAKREARSDKLTKAQLDRVTALARDFTYNMNRAGDMPYNENMLGMLFQFMQVPHKALLQMTTNRSLTRMQKARMAGWNLLIYGGAPGALMTSHFAPLFPEDSEMREVFRQGLEGYMFNKMASLLYGEDVSLDYSSIAAVDQTGLLEFITSLWTTDMGEVMAASPAGALVAGNNPRITNFVRTAAEYFNFREPERGTPVETGELFMEFAKLSSGFSNLFRAKVAWEYGKKYNANGGVTDSSVNKPEAIGTALGFGTLDESRRYWVSSEIYEQRQQFDEDVKEWYRLVKQGLAREGIMNEEREFNRRVLNLAAEQFKDTPRAREIIHQQLRYDIQDGDLSLHNSILNSFPWMDPNRARIMIEDAPGTDEQREQRRRALEYIDSYRNDGE